MRCHDFKLNDVVHAGVGLVAEGAALTIAKDLRDHVRVQSLRHVGGIEVHARVDARIVHDAGDGLGATPVAIDAHVDGLVSSTSQQ